MPLREAATSNTLAPKIHRRGAAGRRDNAESSFPLRPVCVLRRLCGELILNYKHQLSTEHKTSGRLA